MARLTNKQLISLLTVITSLLSGLVQILYSYSAIQMLLIDEYNRTQTELQNLVRERNVSLRRYIRQKERFFAGVLKGYVHTVLYRPEEFSK